MYYNFVNLIKDWFFDMIINFLRSPRWKTPIMSFIDENCIVFDTEDENKLEYTIIHAVRHFPGIKHCSRNLRNL